MSLPLPDFGLTSWIDFTNSSEVTADAQLRISAVGDSLGLIADFTQATDANKPLYSRSDNRENRIHQSELATAVSAWLLTRAGINFSNIVPYTTPDGTLISLRRFREDSSSGTHVLTTNSAARHPVVDGGQYVLTVYATSANRGLRIEPQNGISGVRTIDLVDGVIVGTSTGVTIEQVGVGIYKIDYLMTAGSTNNNASFNFYITNPSSDGTTSYTGDGASGVNMALQFRAVNTDPTYLPTTDHPQYAGVNGRSCLVFNGAQFLNTTSLLSDVYAAANSLTYSIILPFKAAAGERWHSSETGASQLKLDATNKFTVQFADGVGTKTLSTTNNTMLVNSLVIVRSRHSGGSQYLTYDYGAGFVTEASLVTGDRADLTQIIGGLGATTVGTAGFYGKILAIGTANTGAAKPNMETLLREYFFARSQLRWDPYLADLVLKRQ